MPEKKVLWDSTSLDLVNLSDMPLKGSYVDPVSQHTSVNEDLADILGNRVCGPSCVAMALQAFKKYPKNKSLSNIEFLLVDLVNMHKSNGNMVKFKTTLDSREVDIPVELAMPQNEYLLKDARYFVVKENNQYAPVFSLVNGYDHRGSERVFAKYGLKAGFFEKVGLSYMVTQLKSNKALIVSVIPRRLSAKFHFETEKKAAPAHLVLITDLLEINGVPYFHVIDPDHDIKDGVMPKYLLDETGLSKICNWRGTFVSEML